MNKTTDLEGALNGMNSRGAAVTICSGKAALSRGCSHQA